MGLGLPLALITGWLVAQSADQNPKPAQQSTQQPKTPLKSLKRSAQTQISKATEPEQRLEQRVLSHPREWRWRLQLAQTKLQRGDRDGAKRELITLQALWPKRPEVQDLQLLLEVGTKHQATALKQTSDRFKQIPKGQRLALGLRLADLQRLSGQDNAAITTYRLIAAESPKKIEPLLALALLHRDQGQNRQSQKVLLKARNRMPVSEQDKQVIDQIAVRWQLDSLRKGADRTAKPPATMLPAPSKALAETTPKP
jgi:Flp pilus assembly protein TadD